MPHHSGNVGRKSRKGRKLACADLSAFRRPGATKLDDPLDRSLAKGALGWLLLPGTEALSHFISNVALKISLAGPFRIAGLCVGEAVFIEVAELLREGESGRGNVQPRHEGNEERERARVGGEPFSQ